jgi:catechol 2,3-dioxygenase-like lactoylglutathione lyase family enzyme
MSRPPLRGIHHLKFAVADLARSLAFYERVFHAQRIVAADHKHPDGSIYAHILDVPGLGTYLELRLDPTAAQQASGFDPVTILVDDRDALEAWSTVLDACDVEHSPVLVAIQAWVLVFEDPDGRRLRLYTKSMHGPELVADFNSPWILPRR